jgi:hypothetical protein
MTIHARADAIDQLTDVDGDLIKVPEHIATNFIGQCTNGPPTKGQIDHEIECVGSRSDSLTLATSLCLMSSLPQFAP